MGSSQTLKRDNEERRAGTILSLPHPSLNKLELFGRHH